MKSSTPQQPRDRRPGAAMRMRSAAHATMAMRRPGDVLLPGSLS